MSKRRVQFYRNFRFFTGGHLKVYHYFEHLRSSQDYMPSIKFKEQGSVHPDNPWFGIPGIDTFLGEALRPDVFFLAGMDWLSLNAAVRSRPRVPIVNLIQHPRHADATDPRRQFLVRRAIRVCVSAEVHDALLTTHVVNGPIVTIPNGIDLDVIDATVGRDEKDCDVLIVALKQPEMGTQLASTLRKSLSARIALLVERIPRHDFLKCLQRATVTVFLPHQFEGFYLPAMEGMAVGTIVISPDCLGNRSFCEGGNNCFRPAYALEHLVDATIQALNLSDQEKRQMVARARTTADRHNLPNERKAFLSLMSRIHELW